jgi:catechol 2,3-dioxygenase-like lactoylglutathione lyase family enzyme
MLATRIDHLVVAARTLAEGLAWCRDTFGFEPAAGGEHPLMGTHNRVFRVDSPAFERAYFEIIAINPAAPAPGRTRWFDLDDANMRESLAHGPRLIHFVANTNDVQASVAALAEHRIVRGEVLSLTRGSLRWKMTVRPDGQRLFDGTLPTLLQWESAHPCESLPASGITLQSLEAVHPEAGKLVTAYEAIGVTQVPVRSGEPNLIATLATPNGTVRLQSSGA